MLISVVTGSLFCALVGLVPAASAIPHLGPHGLILRRGGNVPLRRCPTADEIGAFHTLGRTLHGQEDVVIKPAFYAASADICEYIREEESDYLGEYDTSVIQCKRSGASFALNDSTAYNKKGGTIISAVKSSAGRKCRLVEERKGRFMHMEDTSEWKNAIQMKTIHYPRPPRTSIARKGFFDHCAQWVEGTIYDRLADSWPDLYLNANTLHSDEGFPLPRVNFDTVLFDSSMVTMRLNEKTTPTWESRHYKYTAEILEQHLKHESIMANLRESNSYPLKDNSHASGVCESKKTKY